MPGSKKNRNAINRCFKGIVNTLVKSASNKSLIAPTEIRKVSDVSGAGDTVTAIATFGVIQSLSLESIASLANIAAGLVCSKPGVYAIHKEELIQNNN